MTKHTSSEKLRNYICTECKSAYTTDKYIKNKTSRFCSDTCHTAVRNERRNAKGKQTRKQKKLESRFAEFHKTAFGVWLLYEIKRSGTLQVLQALKSSEDLLQLYQLWLFKQRCFGWTKNEDKFTSVYELCHISPCKSKDGSSGLLHPNNLFVGCSTLNRVQGNRPAPAGVGLKVDGALKNNLLLPDKITLAALAKKVRKYLGNTLDDFLTEADKRLGLTERYKLAKRIYNRQQKRTAKHPLPKLYTHAELESKDVAELRAMDEHQTGKSAFVPELSPKPMLEVYSIELERLANTLPDGKHKQLCSTLAPLMRVAYLVKATDPYWLNDHKWCDWQLFNYRYPYTDLGKVDESVEESDRNHVVSSACKLAYQTLQGDLVEVEWFRKRLLKRFTVRNLQPGMAAMYSATWEAMDDITHVEEMTLQWSYLVAAGMISQADADAACMTLRLEYANDWLNDVNEWKRKNRFANELPDWFNRPDLQALLDEQECLLAA
ncbi:hypothetical protein [Pseudomonas nitroreducens]|uniref:hypothetical protein n=1 Tax=Pseudomonas nitroreducens TaxID=46680 RepID=UPI003D2C32B5